MTDKNKTIQDALDEEYNRGINDFANWLIKEVFTNDNISELIASLGRQHLLRKP